MQSDDFFNFFICSFVMTLLFFINIIIDLLTIIIIIIIILNIKCISAFLFSEIYKKNNRF